jgi:hypothetical protein
MNDTPETVVFGVSEEDIKMMAVFCAQLVREGVRFTVLRNGMKFEVRLTGGC